MSAGIAQARGYQTEQAVLVPTAVLLSILNHRHIHHDHGDIREALSHVAGYEVMAPDIGIASHVYEPWFHQRFPQIPRDLPESPTGAENDRICDEWDEKLGASQPLPGKIGWPRTLMMLLEVEVRTNLLHGDGAAKYNATQTIQALTVQVRSHQFFEEGLCPICAMPWGSNKDPERPGARDGCRTGFCCYVTEKGSSERTRINTRKLYWAMQRVIDAPGAADRLPWLLDGTIAAVHYDQKNTAQQPARTLV